MYFELNNEFYSYHRQLPAVEKKVCLEIFAQSSNDHIWCGLVVDWYQPPHPARSKYVFNLSKNKI